jgi:hypothetical protein
MNKLQEDISIILKPFLNEWREYTLELDRHQTPHIEGFVEFLNNKYGDNK